MDPLAGSLGVLFLAVYFLKAETYVWLRPATWVPRFALWGRLLKIGLPAGGEFALIFIHISFIFWVIRRFGADAQAGYGVGCRVIEAIFLPALAIAFAVSPVVGQNFGANQFARVRNAFRSGLVLSTVVMLIPTVACCLYPDWFIRLFSSEQPVIAIGVTYLQIIAWEFIGSGIVFTCSSTFQGLGNTLPSLVSSALRLATFVLPVIWLVQQPWFELRHLWYV